MQVVRASKKEYKSINTIHPAYYKRIINYRAAPNGRTGQRTQYICFLYLIHSEG